MGSRGGGRGRGGRGKFGGGGGFRHAKQESFVLFPDIELPVFDKAKFNKDMELVKTRNRLQLEIRALPYFLEETYANDNESADIERYSEKSKKRSATNRISLENSGFLILQPGYFPTELVQGTKRRMGRKVQWNSKRDLKKLDYLEGLEDKFKDDEGKKGNNGEESENEEDDEDNEVEEEYDSSDDDYTRGIGCDDDDDDFNPPEDNDDDEGGIL